MAVLVDRASHWVRFIAQPSLVQLVLRFALAVPFWRSGILKWDGFLQLNDTAVTLFTDEFKLHLPGGPYPFPAPTVMAFLSGCGEIAFPVLLVLGLRRPFRGARPSVHDPHRRTDRSGWVAHPYHLGGDGSRDHGVWARETFARPPPRACRGAFSLTIEGADSPALSVLVSKCNREGLR